MSSNEPSVWLASGGEVGPDSIDSGGDATV